MSSSRAPRQAWLNPADPARAAALRGYTARIIAQGSRVPDANQGSGGTGLRDFLGGTRPCPSTSNCTI